MSEHTAASNEDSTSDASIFRRRVAITNPHGLHMRPASAFARLAGQFQSQVTLCKEGKRINGKSPLELLFLAAEQGTELDLEVNGPDAQAAIDALAMQLAQDHTDEMDSL
jgi:phosphocarrier protein